MADLAPADVWSYYRGKHGYVTALEEHYKDTLTKRPDIAACVYNIKVAQAYIDTQMAEISATQGDEPPKPRSTANLWAREMTDDELKAEWLAINKTIDEWEAAPAEEKEHGGSPGEGLYERHEEIETEMKKRGLPLEINAHVE